MMIMQKNMMMRTKNDENGDNNDNVADDVDADDDGEPLGGDDSPPCDRLTASTKGEQRRPRRTLFFFTL